MKDIPDNTVLGTLIQRISVEDNAALEKLYREMKDPIYRYALMLLQDYSLAEDAMQVTFLKIMANADTYRPDGNAKAWIFAITRNTCHEMDSEDTAVAYIYLDVVLNEEEPELPADEWESFKITVAEYYDTEIPEEYLDMLHNGTVLRDLGNIAGSYDLDIEDMTFLPELSRIQVTVNKSQLTKITEKLNVKFKVLH